MAEDGGGWQEKLSDRAHAWAVNLFCTMRHRHATRGRDICDAWGSVMYVPMFMELQLTGLGLSYE